MDTAIKGCGFHYAEACIKISIQLSDPPQCLRDLKALRFIEDLGSFIRSVISIHKTYGKSASALSWWLSGHTASKVFVCRNRFPSRLVQSVNTNNFIETQHRTFRQMGMRHQSLGPAMILLNNMLDFYNTALEKQIPLRYAEFPNISISESILHGKIHHAIPKKNIARLHRNREEEIPPNSVDLIHSGFLCSCKSGCLFLSCNCRKHGVACTLKCRNHRRDSFRGKECSNMPNQNTCCTNIGDTDSPSNSDSDSL